MLYSKILKASVGYILSDVFELKNGQAVNILRFKSYVFELFVDKHGQVAGDSMNCSHWSSGSSRLLMKALQERSQSHHEMEIFLVRPESCDSCGLWTPCTYL